MLHLLIIFDFYLVLLHKATHSYGIASLKQGTHYSSFILPIIGIYLFKDKSILRKQNNFAQPSFALSKSQTSLSAQNALVITSDLRY